ncbi:hypothetical protein [Aeromicrobium massiliense]|uniref:hypothetical protein n=1 Tax=Aeromicrobium massiliense TaxID=1464554 RepID=UPI00067633B7|nr:hypothetical protein [Aeromicrobium massiliense]
MRRFLLVLAGVLLALGVAGAVDLLRGDDGDDPRGSGRADVRLADLEVVLDPGTGEPRRAPLACAAAKDSAACTAMDDLDAEALAPVSAGRACSQQFGGPETVRVTGTLRGEPVDASFDRTNGCEISRYEKIEPLLAASGIA